MLRRRYHPQAQAPGKAEGRQETHEADRLRRGAAGSVPGHPPGRRIKKPQETMMPFLTAAVLAAFVGYAGAWYFELVEGNFALLLFLETLVTGLYWIAERLWYLPRRRRAAAEPEAGAHERIARLASQGVAPVDPQLAEARHRILAQPWSLDWTAGLFPVILAVFVLRSF